MNEFDIYEYEGNTVKVPKGTDVSESLLDSMANEQNNVKKAETHKTKLEDARRASEVMFPRSTKAFSEYEVGKGFGSAIAAMGMDISSAIPTSLVAAGRTLDTKFGLSGDKPQSYLESFEQISKGQGPTGEPNMVSDVVSDPATLPSMAAGSALGGWVLKGGKWLPKVISQQIGKATTKGVETVGRGVVSGVTEGLGSSAIHQTENVLEDKPISGKEIAVEVGVSGLAPAVLAGPAKLMNKGLGVLADQLSNVSEDALRKWGTGLGKGAKQLKGVQGKQREIGKALLDALDDFDEFVPEKPLIDEALEKMGDIPMGRTIGALEKTIKDFPMKNVNKKALGKLNELLADAKEKGSVLSSSEFKKFRGEIDDIVEWGKTGAKKLNSSLKDVRTSMKDELIEVAENSGNKEYAPLMSGWADKLQKRNALLEQIGASSKSRDNKIGVFMSTLFNENKDVRREALKNMTDIFGKDFVEQAKLLQMSGEVMQKGSQFSKILPNWTTGKATTALTPALASGAAYSYLKDPRALAAAIVLGAQSSPMLASKTLKVADLVEWMAGQSKLPARKIAQENTKEK